MTQLLEKAVEALNALPDERQDRYASEILSELEANRLWDEAKGASTAIPEWAIEEILQLSSAGELSKSRLHSILEEAIADQEALAAAETVLEDNEESVPWETVKREFNL